MATPRILKYNYIYGYTLVFRRYYGTFQNATTSHYFWVFDSKKQYERKWVLKSHKSKDYIILTQSEALEYILIMAKSPNPTEIQSVRNGRKYRKSITKHKG